MDCLFMYIRHCLLTKDSDMLSMNNLSTVYCVRSIINCQITNIHMYMCMYIDMTGCLLCTFVEYTRLKDLKIILCTVCSYVC